MLGQHIDKDTHFCREASVARVERMSFEHPALQFGWAITFWGDGKRPLETTTVDDTARMTARARPITTFQAASSFSRATGFPSNKSPTPPKRAQASSAIR
jgi:hypothetical protein